MASFKWANPCVKDVHAKLIELVSLQGIDFNCKYKECQCLYDEDTLDRCNSHRFDEIDCDEYGYGSSTEIDQEATGAPRTLTVESLLKEPAGM